MVSVNKVYHVSENKKFGIYECAIIRRRMEGLFWN